MRFDWTTVTFLLTLVASPQSAGAIEPVLIKDINPNGDSHDEGLKNCSLVQNTLFLVADDGTHGMELWKSDGTPEGTVLVKDLITGSGSPFPTGLTNAGGTLYFTAEDARGRELWKSDGTAEGTVIVKDILSGPESSLDPGVLLVAVGDLVFFSANDGSTGVDVWRSDGTETGTFRLTDINPGPGSSVPSSVPSGFNFTMVDGTFFFLAATFEISGPFGGGPVITQLWKSDGTEVGTVVIKDEFPTQFGPAFLGYLTAGRGAVYFAAFCPECSSSELWRSDGTPEGTVFLTDHIARFIPITRLAPVDNLVFWGECEPWVTDGTPEGTREVKDIFPSGCSVDWGDFDSFSIGALNGELYFNADDDSGTGRELWKSDGTEAGTVFLKDIRPGFGSFGPLGGGGSQFTEFEGLLYFAASDGSNGGELWKTDGTPGGTVLAVDLNPGPGASRPTPGPAAAFGLFFLADDGVHGRELWILPPDCNGNDASDLEDISLDTSQDCDGNRIPDECDIATAADRGEDLDLNQNGILDTCDPDCNENSFPDDLDIADGTSQDTNTDGFPDECSLFLRADANGDGRVNIADPSFIANAIFIAGAPQPECEMAADANGDGRINIADPSFVANSIFIQGALQPPPPFPLCGAEPEARGLTCETPPVDCPSP